MIENSSLCLICTSKVNICCNLRIDYEDKYKSKCLQKILSYSNCLLCDSNSTSLAKTQDLPSSMLQQIELFMNSTSFPESYSNSVICLTCIHFLNIWHKVRSSLMQLIQYDKNYGAFDFTDETKKTKPTKNNEEKLTVIDLVDEIVESYENKEDTLQSDSLNLGSTKANIFEDELSITTIDYSFDNENESITASQLLLPKALKFSTSISDSEKSSQYFSATSSNFLIDNSSWITTKTKFPSIMENSSSSEIINENFLQKLKPKLKFKRPSSTCSKASSQSEGRKHKRYNNDDQGQEATLTDNSSDSEKNCEQSLSKKHVSRKSETKQNNKSVKDFQSETIPENGLDEKLYKQLPYVLLNNDEVPKIKMVPENLPKINSINIALLDDESFHMTNTSLGDFKTWCCRICNKTSKTLCEHKTHELFHIKPEQVVINVVRKNLKQLQDRQATENIDKILAKYLDIDKLQDTPLNEQASGSGCLDVKDKKLCVPLVKGKFSSTRKNNSACQNTPNVVNESKQRLSILVNKRNSKDKSDNFLRTPKKVRFSLDSNKSIVPNLQSIEDLYLS